ncbi:MAG: HDOD domain-containing protein [Gammaproteobacteria bacterium]|nr:HDOD domain-containing protein [Gammaproteobacteria bacterium]
MEELYIARQPIYDSQLHVIGYELLYRSGDMDQAIFDDADQASCETIMNAFMHIGIDTLIGSTLAFINLPTQFITNAALTPMLRGQCVLEILEHVKPTEDVIQGIKRLKSEGYKIALDDFEFQDKYTPLLQLADYIKLEVNTRTEDELAEHLRIVSTYSAKIIAEKVETQEIYNICKNLGFKYFQGFFFCRPQLVKHKHIPANKLVVLNLLSKLQNPDLDYEEFESILAQDITLTYKLMRYINSASFPFRREVDSIKDAVILIGIKNMKDWVTLIMISKISEDKPNELIVTAMIRGKMCELLAAKYHPEIQHQMFLVGLFSVLDALMDTPMIDLLDCIILSVPIKMALLDKAGPHGEIYQQVLLYEHSSWDKLNSNGFDKHDLITDYLDAVHWADTHIQALLS